MFGGGGGLNPRKMQKMMEQMGIEMDELDVTRVVMDLEGGERLVFDDADVTMMEARGQETYQVVGEPTRQGAGEIEAGDAGEEADAGTAEATDAGIPEDDIELVAQRTGVDAETAREALEEEDGDLAAAIARLE